MEETTALCVTLGTLILALTAMILCYVIGGYGRDVKMAELGYEQAEVPGTSRLIWRKAQ